MNIVLNMMLAILISVEYTVVEAIDNKLKMRKMAKTGQMMDISTLPKNWELFLYYTPCIMLTFLYSFFNLNFLNVALVDIVRRNY